MCSFGNMDRDLFRNLKQQSHEFITPSNSNIFLIPNTRSTFSWILRQECKSQIYVCVHLLSLGLWIIHWQIFHFLPEFSVFLKQIMVKNEVTYITCNKISTWMTCLHLYLTTIDILFHLTIFLMCTLVLIWKRFFHFKFVIFRSIWFS